MNEDDGPIAQNAVGIVDNDAVVAVDATRRVHVPRADGADRVRRSSTVGSVDTVAVIEVDVTGRVDKISTIVIPTRVRRSLSVGIVVDIAVIVDATRRKNWPSIVCNT